MFCIENVIKDIMDIVIFVLTSKYTKYPLQSY